MAFEEIGVRFSATGVESTLADVKRVDNELGRITNTAKKSAGPIKSASSAFSGWGKSLTGFGMALAPITAAIGGVGAAGIWTAANFETAMTEISARTGIVGEDLKRIEQFALEMGEKTVFSAQEAAQGFLELLASGQSAEEAIATLPVVLDLAAASGEDLGFTADALTDILAEFNLGVEDATFVADALARAAGASSADVASLAAGFSNVGPVARQFGIDVDTTAATLAVLSENGIKGAEAGTALKSMLLTMTKPTEDVQNAWAELGTSFYDAEGNARPLNTVLGDIKLGLTGLPLEQQNLLLRDLGGAYGVVALNALLGDMAIGDMETAMQEQASASEVASARMGTFAGGVETLKGSIATLMIKALLPVMNETLKEIVENLTVVITKITEWVEKNPKLASAVVKLTLGLVALTAISLALGAAMTAVGALIGALTSPIFLVILAVIALAWAWQTNFLGIRDTLTDVWNNHLKPIFEDLKGWLDDKIPVAIGIAKEVLDGLETVFLGIRDAIQWAIDKVTPFINAIAKISVPQAITDLYNTLSGIVGFLARVTGGGGGEYTGTELNEEDKARLQALTEPGREGIISQQTPTPGEQWGGKYGVKPFWAGEKGPELLFPKTSGFVASNHFLRNLANNMMNPIMAGGTTNRTINYQPVFNVQSDEGAYYANQNQINLLTLANQT